MAVLLPSSYAADSEPYTPQLLLTAQRLRRLQRDRQRQTPRWVNFENRIEAAPDSPERGFELALYYAVAHDQSRGREAIQWAIAHRCERRQVALILDWCADLITDAERQRLLAQTCAQSSPGSSSPIVADRDGFFLSVVRGNPDQAYGKNVVEFLKQNWLNHSADLYAGCELMSAFRTNKHVDLRENAPEFFSILPTEILLGLKPNEVLHPPWQTHIAALALVDLDPNLEGSQYLQGWAIEDAQMLREGPGVAYELLWGDPYLPGVGYQNLDPWVYDPTGRVFARTDWNETACWITISTAGVEDWQCPAGWQNTATTFGRMTLIPMTPPCIQVLRQKNNESTVIWKLKPNGTVTFSQGKQQQPGKADAAGMLRLGANQEGKMCVVNR